MIKKLPNPLLVPCPVCKLNALILYFVKHPKMKVLMHRYQAKLVKELDEYAQQLEVCDERR